MASGRSLGVLTLDLAVKTGALEQGMDKAQRITKKGAKDIESNASKIGSTIGTAIGAGVVAGATAAVYALKSAIDRMDELSKSAQKIGVTTEALSKLAYAADLSDVSIEQLQGGLAKLVKFQAEAAQGADKNAETFAAFGIAIKDSAGNLRGTEAVFSDFAEVFKNLPDGPEKTALALRVFGKAGAELIPLLNEGKDGLAGLGDEAERFGKVISTQAGKEAEEFNDNLTRLQSQVGGLAQQVAADLLPDLLDLVDEFQNLISEGGDVKETAHTIANAFRALADVIAIVVNLTTAQSKALGGLGLAAKAAFDGATGDFDAAGESLKQSAAAFADAKNDVNQAIARLQGTDSGSTRRPNGPDFSNVVTGTELAAQKAAQGAARRLLANEAPKDAKASKAKTGKSDAEREAEQLANAYKNLNASLDERIALIGKEGEAAQVTYDVTYGALVNLTDAEKKAVIAKAEKYDLDQKAFELAKEASELDKQQAEGLAQLLDDLQFENDLIGKTNAQRAAEIELRRLGIELSDEEYEANRKRIQGLVEEGEARQQQIEGMDELREMTKDLFVDLIDGEGSARDAIDGFVDNFRKKMTALVAEKLVEKLLGAFGSAGGGAAGGGWGQLIGAVFGGARATGGPVSGGTPYLVGERGPEIMVPRGSGTIIPNKSIGGSKQVNQTFVIDTKGQPITKETQQQLAMAAGQAAAEAMARNR